jgi:hypothetical protein
MTTVDPTALQAARLAIGHLRVTWPLLGDLRDASSARTVRSSAPLSARAREARDELLRAERADRGATLTYRALAPSPAPANLQLLDAEVETLATVGATAWAIRSDLREWTRGRHGVRHIPAIPHDVDGKLSWLTTGLDYTSPAVVDQAAADLTAAARRLASATGTRLDDDWRGSGKRCPACGLRALWTWRRSPVKGEATVECRGEPTDPDSGRSTPCRCRGDDCPCGRPGARPGTRHLWPA